jgi:hypothetical protein
MADVLDKILKLMRLAVNNTNEHEARNAAFKAVQYIHEHKVELRLPGAAPPPRPPSEPFHNPFDPFGPFGMNDLNEILRRAQARAESQRAAAAQRAADQRAEAQRAEARRAANEAPPGTSGGNVRDPYVYYRTPTGEAPPPPPPRYSARRSVLIDGKRHIVEVLSGNSMCPICHRQISAGTESYYTTLGDLPGYRHVMCHETYESHTVLDEG